MSHQATSPRNHRWHDIRRLILASRSRGRAARILDASRRGHVNQCPLWTNDRSGSQTITRSGQTAHRERRCRGADTDIPVAFYSLGSSCAVNNRPSCSTATRYSPNRIRGAERDVDCLISLELRHTAKRPGQTALELSSCSRLMQVLNAARRRWLPCPVFDICTLAWSERKFYRRPN